MLANSFFPNLAAVPSVSRSELCPALVEKPESLSADGITDLRTDV